MRVGLTAAGVLVMPPVRMAGARGTGPNEARPGKIYITVHASPDDADPTRPNSLLAIDPQTGDSTKVLERFEFRPRISPDGRTLAFERDKAIWLLDLAEGDPPRRIIELDGPGNGSPPVWSSDGKRIIISPATRDEKDEHWTFTTLRFDADGSGRARLEIPEADGVQDWSSDGEWLLTASHRNAKIGWQLYVMRLDGTGQRQVTEGGNPYYARFSPDGRRLLYSDGTTEERRGIWVADVDGERRERIIATGGALASACWSPDGRQIAVIVEDRPAREMGRDLSRIDVMDADGGHRSSIPMPGKLLGDMPDWR